VFILVFRKNDAHLGETSLHLLSVAKGKVAENEIEARLKVRHGIHYGFEGLDGVLELTKAHKCVSNVAEDFEPNFLSGVWDLVEGHAVHLNSLGELLLTVVDVAHVDAQPAALRILLVLHDNRVRVQSFLVHAVLLVNVSQVEPNGVREVNVDLVNQPVGVAVFGQGSFLLSGVLGLL
tara:strand:+ start:169 stop:702 length:534 start_codon:yes stop_codon:yes gene_type:complete